MTRNTDDTATNRRRTTDDTDGGAATDSQTMRGVSHTHPETGETFGDSQVYQRGTVAVVDGGEADSASDDGEEEPMKDVDHTPREGAPAANEVYERGGEGTETDETADEEDDDETSADQDGEEPV